MSQVIVHGANGGAMPGVDAEGPVAVTDVSTTVDIPDSGAVSKRGMELVDGSGFEPWNQMCAKADDRDDAVTHAMSQR